MRFPPFALIPAIINKIRQHYCNIVLIVPLWAEMSWFPDILQLVVALVIWIPSHKNRRKLKTSRLEFIRRSIRDWKFSANVARHAAEARRSSTRRVYDAKWKVFSDWCMQREAHPFSATPSEVADFLLHLFQKKKCQVSTIKGYRSTVSNTLKFKSDNNIGSDPIISELIKSFELQRPVQRSLAPKWDLSFVLSSLYSEPYEPLHKASRFHLTLKQYFCLPWQQRDVFVRFMPSPWIQDISDSISQKVRFL